MASVVEDIADGFADTPLPQGDLLEPGAEAEYEGQRILVAFRGQRWRDLPGDVLAERHEALEYFTPQALRYYLPAFLIAAIDRYEEDGDLASFVIGALTPPGEGDAAAKPPADPVLARMHRYYASGEAARDFAKRVAVFSPKEAHAVRTFLEYMDREHRADFPLSGPRQALERYWASGAG